MQLHPEFLGGDRYRLDRRIGAGGMGVVYEAYDRERGMHVALKTLRSVGGAEIYRLKREFRALADLSHPNLVALYELHADGDIVYFTMEYVEGEDFCAHVRGHPSLAFDETVDTPSVVDGVVTERHAQAGIPSMSRFRSAARQLAEGVQALHEAGLIHRDIKPSNVLVTPTGRVVILDFGLVSELTRLGEPRDVEVVGTPAYMAPEQAVPGKLSEACDWYSVGCMLYETLIGRLPFTGKALAVLAAKKESAPLPPSFYDVAIPADLDQLVVSLLAPDPANRPAPRDILSRLGSSWDSYSWSRMIDIRLVGRDDELLALRRAFERSHEQGVAAYVHGASGMGKTALVRSFLEELEDAGKAWVLSGRCFEQESVPYKAFDSLVDVLSRRLVRMPRAEVEPLFGNDAAALSRLFPVLKQVPTVLEARRRTAETPDVQELRRRGFAALRDLILKISERRPVVLCIDDLQWGDVDSAALLLELYRTVPARILFVGIFRTEEAEGCAFTRALGGGAPLAGLGVPIQEVAVGPLRAADASTLAERLLDPSAGDLAGRAGAVARESAGSPFFVAELVRHLEGGTAVEGATLDGLLAQRVVRLPGRARRLLELVAVAGVPLAQAVVKRAAEIHDDARDAVALLRSAHLVRTRGVRDQDHIEPYHDRIRQALVTLLDADARRGCHLALGEALEGDGTADPEALAFHFREAGETERAAGHMELAAARAADALAFDRAAALYRDALALGRWDGAERRRLCTALGDALSAAGRGAQAGDAYLEAAGLPAPAAELLELRRRAAEQLLRSGHVARGTKVLDEVLASVGTHLARTPRRALLSLAASRAKLRLRGLGYRERDTSQIAAERLTEIDVYWSVSTALGMVDNIRAADFQTRHLLRALVAGEPYRVARALATEACFSSAAGLGAAERSARLCAGARAAATRSDHPHALGMATFAEGFVACLEGRYDAGRALCREAVRQFRDRCTSVTWEVTVMQQLELATMHYTGDVAALRLEVPALRREAVARGDLYAAANLGTWIANSAWLVDDDIEGARRAIREASVDWGRDAFLLQDYWRFYAAANVDLYAGHAEAAWRRIEEHWHALKRSLLLRIQGLRVEGHWLRARAALRLHERLGEPALLRSAERDADAAAGAKFTWAGAAADLVRAGVAQARGETATARRLAERSAIAFDACGVALYAAAARRDADWLRARGVKDPEAMIRLYAPGM